MDYVDGKLLVDPQKMMNDGYGDIAKIIAFCIARYVEKKWIRFEPSKKNWKSALICVLGLAGMILLKQQLRPVITGWLGSHWGKLVFSVIHVVYYIALVPLVLRLVNRNEG